ncbi:hypothetical protein ASPACDRAFT_45162 [Aspergillus aculeatus ATCC 16872]|uniref:Protein phosphatase 4 core regulatory subunit R2 n=1 Tax=Aspergillus aculeatus (strain ATCC 16872 / CBS 172.66 / WB 5094) TaxID=690307 RepID=A0A1L9WNW0_ASPA1|nr:uncharacterized protein ASPACDRAFT_45162 [Aspergillus aculeatus ATCC 16872]OJJ97862.1 hypothetical protein ASPACDRAFT_45162 [Aspergillus aculeatus ATCC 16872]
MSDEESLETAANGGAIDPSKWPNIVEPLLERLQHNVYNAFPMPRVPAAPAQPPTLPSAATILAQDPTPTTNNSTDSTGSTSADTSNPPNLQTPPRPTATSPTTTPLSSSERIPDSQPGPSSTSSTNATTLPAPLDHLLTAISTNIRTLFPSKPPHTIQRLAELILRPTAHYRTLPAYLRAVDRVISVTSPADIFPFQTTTGTQQPVLSHHQQPNGTLNGSATAAAAAAAAAAEPSFMFSVDNALGSDESLGGALLTPIPWLHNAASSPDGEGDQEAAGGDVVGVIGQSETGFAAAAETTTTGSGGGVGGGGGGGGGGEPTTATMTGEIDPENEVMGGMESMPTEPVVEDVPHARGPPVVGVEDLGLQDGKGVEMTLDGAAESGQQQQQQQQQQDQTQEESQESAAGLQGGPQQQEQQSSQGGGQAQEGNAKPGTDGDGDIALEDAKAEEMSATSEKDHHQQQQQQQQQQ